MPRGSRRTASARRPRRTAVRSAPEALGFYGYRVRDVMTRPVISVAPSASLADAASRMSRRGISGLPVVSTAGRLVGVVSQKDILRLLGARAGLRLPGSVFDLLLPASVAGRSGLAERCRSVLDAVAVREAMSRPARTVGPEVLLDDAVRLLVAAKINRLPVVHQGKVVGIVTRTDLLSGLTTA